MKAHQRLIREQEASSNPRAIVPLDGCTVQPVSKAWAGEIIYRYEWLGSMPLKGEGYYGLIGPNGEALGVACFGHGSGSNSKTVCGDEHVDKVSILERGACTHFAHEHAASFLISRAVKAMHRDHGKKIFVAYSDAAAGEIGTVYQACNWIYLGSSNGRGSHGYRWEGRFAGGKWMNSRSLRRQAVRDGYAKGDTAEWWTEKRQDPNWEFRKVFDRSRYVHFEGSFKERKLFRQALRYQPQPYPKR